MSKVSIIVPIYNVEQYLRKCLDSLTMQTFKDIEIWAVSDGSPDNSVKIIKEYAKKDKRVKCIENENGGYGSVLEYAIKNMNTEYFLICDPDDWLTNDAVEVLYNKAKEYDLDIVVGTKYTVYNDNSEEIYETSKFDGCDVVSDKVYEDIHDFYFLQPSPHAKLYRASLCKDIVFPHKVSFTDYLLYLLALSKAKRVMYLDKALAYYLVDRPGNSMTDTKPKVFDDHQIVLNSVLDQVKDNYDKMIYARLFFQLRNVLIFMGTNANHETKKRLYNTYLDILRRLAPFKKDILKNYPNLSFKDKEYFSLLLTKKDSNIQKKLFNRIIKY